MSMHLTLVTIPPGVPNNVLSPRGHLRTRECRRAFAKDIRIFKSLSLEGWQTYLQMYAPGDLGSLLDIVCHWFLEVRQLNGI